MVGPNLTIGHLMGMMVTFYKAIGIEQIKYANHHDWHKLCCRSPKAKTPIAILRFWWFSSRTSQF